MQIITAAVIKGGTGKSSTIAALAQAAAAAGKKVLAIDLDPQANCSFFIGADQNFDCHQKRHRGAGDVVEGFVFDEDGQVVPGWGSPPLK